MWSRSFSSSTSSLRTRYKQTAGASRWRVESNKRTCGKGTRIDDQRGLVGEREGRSVVRWFSLHAGRSEATCGQERLEWGCTKDKKIRKRIHVERLHMVPVDRLGRLWEWRQMTCIGDGAGSLERTDEMVSKEREEVRWRTYTLESRHVFLQRKRDIERIAMELVLHVTAEEEQFLAGILNSAQKTSDEIPPSRHVPSCRTCKGYCLVSLRQL